jgi:hypothetical protein
MKYNYASEVAAGACPECGQPVILYHHVRLTTGEKRKSVTVLDSIFCRDCVVQFMVAAGDKNHSTGWPEKPT